MKDWIRITRVPNTASVVALLLQRAVLSSKALTGLPSLHYIHHDCINFHVAGHNSQHPQLKGGDVQLGCWIAFCGWPAGSKAETLWQSGIVEQSCLAHGDQKAKQGNSAREKVRDQTWTPRTCLCDALWHARCVLHKPHRWTAKPLKLTYLLTHHKDSI